MRSTTVSSEHAFIQKAGCHAVIGWCIGTYLYLPIVRGMADAQALGFSGRLGVLYDALLSATGVVYWLLVYGSLLLGLMLIALVVLKTANAFLGCVISHDVENLT